MSEASRDMDSSIDENKGGPNYFDYFAREVASLLSQTECFFPFVSQTSDSAGGTSVVNSEMDITQHSYSGKDGDNSEAAPLFCNAFGAEISDFVKERLNALLRQGVVLLSQEVDEMVDPVFSMHRIQRYKMKISCRSSATCEDNGERPRKKQKLCSSPSSIRSSPISCIHSGESVCHDCRTKSKEETEYLTIKDRKTKKVCEIISKEEKKSLPVKDMKKSVGKSKLKKGMESLAIKEKNTNSVLASNVGLEQEDCEINDELQLLLDTDTANVTELLKKHSDELSETLGCKKQKLEGLLDTIMTSYRLMTPTEKQQLQILIQKLPPGNLNRVVEIIKRNNPSANHSSNLLLVDLERVDNTTLWRLYYFVQAVESAMKLASVG